MGGARPQTLLLVLILAVPVVVALALLVAVLLQRAGFGLLVWAILPFVVSMALIGGLGLVLGRAATRGRPDDGRSRGDDGV
jgi:hypothetical protein